MWIHRLDRPIAWLAAAAAVALGVPRDVEAELIVNGGFETPTLPAGAQAFIAGDNALFPWQITSGSVDVVTDGFWPAFEGRQSIDLSGVAAGTMQQSFATTSGQSYQLSFHYANNTGIQTASATVTINGVETLLSQDISHSGSTGADMNYTPFLGTFVADSTTATLQFASNTPGVFGIALDAVSVNAVPEPSSLVLLGVGMGSFAAGLRRRALWE